MSRAYRQAYQRRAFAALFFLMACAISPRLGLAQYRFDHWTADNGLPQNSVRDIVQTRDGYLWLATLDGLVRFDGVRFTIFNKSNSTGIISNRFLQLYEDGQGDLWAITENSGLTRLQQGRFTTYTTAHGLPVNSINSIGGDGQGHLLMFSGALAGDRASAYRRRIARQPGPASARHPQSCGTRRTRGAGPGSVEKPV
jgi:ligand-binding sensor domain-containing protein